MNVLFFALSIIGIKCSSTTEESSTSSSESDATWKTAAFLLLSGILVTLFTIVFLSWKLKTRIEANAESVHPSNNENRPLHNPKDSKSSTNNQENKSEWSELLIASCSDDLDLEWTLEIDARKLEIKEVIEEGYFSKIQKGTLKMAKPRNIKEKGKRLDVTVKGAINQQDRTHQQMISDELVVMLEITKHPNLLALVGYVVISNQMLIVSESVGQNLLQFLKDRRGLFETNNSESRASIENLNKQNGFYNVAYPETTEEFEPISFVDLLAFAYQIANGMRHLRSMSYVHRQLELRNVYTSNDKTIRIGEFGLARRHGNNHYYRTIKKEVPPPSHWMAPETFKGNKFTEKSDVWSFAVCLWELFTLGKTPYEGLTDVLAFLNEGERLEKPDYCDEATYNFMKSCWELDASERPCFSHCVTFFEEQLKKQDTEVFADLFQKLETVSLHQEQLKEWTNGSKIDDGSGDSV